MIAFMKYVCEHHGLSISTYQELWDFSVTHTEFWEDLWRFLDPVADVPAQLTVGTGPTAFGHQDDWFPGVSLNYTENVLRHDASVHFLHESGLSYTLEAADLKQRTLSLASFMKSELGVVPGDVVAGILPNIPEAVISMLATASIGAVWAACSPDFGDSAILDRFSQLSPKVVIVTNGYTHKGVVYHISDRMASVCRALLPDSLSHVIQHDYLSVITKENTHEGHDGAAPPHPGVPWPVALVAPPLPSFTRFPFSHPLFIMFSSGTTGVPKCMVQSTGGVLLNQLKEHTLHIGTWIGDTMLYMTTVSWMMHNWLVAALAAGANIIVYDGAPTYPAPADLWVRVGGLGVTLFGTSAQYIDSLRANDIALPSAAVPNLRAVLSTGSPLASIGFDYINQQLPQAAVWPISGGSDINGCFVGPTPPTPVSRGFMTGALLGVAADVVDESGGSIVNQSGELVCRKPIPSMPLRFMHDQDGSRYHNAYFTRFPQIWTHGDFALKTVEGHFKIFGRSDATLNPSGVRIGTAEIYRPLSQIPEIVDSVVVGQRWKSSQRIVLFVVLRPNTKLTEPLIQRIKSTIRSSSTPRHVPSLIVAAPGVPYTSNGKKLELSVSDVVNGRPPRVGAGVEYMDWYAGVV